MGNATENRERRNLRGYTPFSFQRAVHKHLDRASCSGKIVVVKSRRQCGKSMMIENELLRYAINHEQTYSACLSPTLKQSKKMFKEITDAISASGIIKSSNATDLEIQLINRSKIVFKSAEQGDALRGFSVTGILCVDEACFIPEEIFYIVLPWCDWHHAPILIVSTPKMRSGWFYDYYMRGMAGGSNIVSIDWCAPEYKEDMDMILPPSKLEEYRRMLPKGIFITEYLGEFVDDGGGVFTVPRWYPKSSQGNSIYFGIDWACGSENGDYTAVVGFNEFGEQVCLEYWNDINDPNEQISRIAGILKRYGNKVKKVLAEKNSIGDVYIKLLKKAVPYQITEFNTSNSSKREIVEGLVAGLNEGVHLCEDAEQKKQFMAYQMEITKGGSITYNGAFGIHDDIVIATCLAHNARTSNKGNYCLIF